MSDLFHISDTDFDRYHFDAIRGPELAMIEEHLLGCFHCQRREEKFCATFGRKGTAMMDHVTTENLELFHLGRVTDALAIAEIEHHISECQECADRMLAIDRFIALVQAGVVRRDSTQDAGCLARFRNGAQGFDRSGRTGLLER